METSRAEPKEGADAQQTDHHGEVKVEADGDDRNGCQMTHDLGRERPRCAIAGRLRSYRRECRFLAISLVRDGLIQMDHAEEVVAQRCSQTTQERRSEDQTILVGKVIQGEVKIIQDSNTEDRVICTETQVCDTQAAEDLDEALCADFQSGQRPTSIVR